MSLLFAQGRQSSNQLNITCTYNYLSNNPFNNKHYMYFMFMVPRIIIYSMNNQQMQLYAVNFMFMVPRIIIYSMK